MCTAQMKVYISIPKIPIQHIHISDQLMPVCVDAEHENKQDK